MPKAEPPESPGGGDRPALRNVVGREAYARYEQTLETLGGPERAAVVARIERGQEWGDVGRTLGEVSEDQARTTVCRAILELSGTTPAVAAEGTGLSALVLAVAERASVDWDGELRRAADEREREVVRQIRIIDDLARFCARSGEIAVPGAVRMDPARTLSHYRLIEKIGEGGMGVVYRADDLTLKRPVALKLLTHALHEDQRARARFLREARTAASLNHPNICVIHDFGEVERGEEETFGEGERVEAGTPFIAMELVEGKTLAQRIAKKPLPVKEALEVCLRIAEGLEAAHERGIVHRDLKPANVKITPGGKVKVLDFGLAKAIHLEPVAADTTVSQTLTDQLTRPGMIVGTLAYMSPEQTQGNPVDKRTDIWAFGCILYECLTAKRPFVGDTVTGTLAAILMGEPDWQALPPTSGQGINALLHRCLAKDTQRRLHDIADARLEIEAALGLLPGEPSLPSSAVPGPARWKASITGGVVGALIVALAMTTWFVLRRDLRPTGGLSTKSSPMTHTVIDLPSDSPLAIGALLPIEGVESPALALSPDGRHLAYVGLNGETTVVYVRDLAATDVRRLAGTEGAIHPFFSPDSRWVGFLTNDKVKKVPLGGGVPLTLCDAAIPMAGWWTTKDEILFTEHEGTSASRVAAAGGRPKQAVEMPRDKDRYGWTLTDVLPDGRTALGARRISSIGSDFYEVAVVSLESLESRVLLQRGYGPRYVPPGYIVFARGGNLLAVLFDADRLEVHGEPVLVASGVGMESFWGQVHVAASSAGLLAYAPGGDLAVGRLAWVDRKGKSEFLEVPARVYGAVDLAPKGDRLAVHVLDVKDYIWIYDINRREGRELSGKRNQGSPVWDPEGRSIAFVEYGEGVPTLMTRRVHDNTPAQSIISAGGASSWSPDGQTLGLVPFLDRGPSFVDLTGRIEAGPLEGGIGSFSPDGHWFAYDSTESGRSEIYIASRDDPRTVRQVSVEGAVEPLWCSSGELFFRRGNRWLATRVTVTPDLRWDPPYEAFTVPDFIDTWGRSYAVSPDGQRLLVVRRPESIPRLTVHVLANWIEALERRAPGPSAER